MTFPLSQLLTPTGRDAMFDELIGIAQTVGMAITSWRSGDVVRTILLTVSQKLADDTLVSVEITKSGFGDYVSDDLAPVWAKQTYNVDIVEAAPATGSSGQATNATLQQHDLDPGELIVAHATTGKTYRNQAAISILASAVTGDIALAADEVGTGSDAAPGAITQIVAPAMSGVTFTNTAAVLGADRETTPALVTRSRRKLGSLSPMGPKDSYNYVATTPELSPTSTPITRTLTVIDITTGALTVYLATADGAPVSGDVDIVQAAIESNAEPWGAEATAVGATNHPIAVTYQVWIKGSNLTVLQIEAAIATALAVYLKTVDIGGEVIPPDSGEVYVEALDRAIGAATPGILRIAIALPASDVVLADNEVAVLGTVTPTITVL